LWQRSFGEDLVLLRVPQTLEEWVGDPPGLVDHGDGKKFTEVPCQADLSQMKLVYLSLYVGRNVIEQTLQALRRSQYVVPDVRRQEAALELLVPATARSLVAMEISEPISMRITKNPCIVLKPKQRNRNAGNTENTSPLKP
jgi:hypothetical protein